MKLKAIILVGLLVLVIYTLTHPQNKITRETTTTTKQEKPADEYGVRVGNIVKVKNQAFWQDQYGGSLPNGFRVRLWENTLDWGKGKGKVTGYTDPGSSLVVLMVKPDDYLVSDRITEEGGWISKMQIEQ